MIVGTETVLPLSEAAIEYSIICKLLKSFRRKIRSATDASETKENT